MARTIQSLTAAEAALLAKPGEGWRYSNFGYELLAYAAATTEKRAFHELLREQVFGPAGMTTATVQLADSDPAVLRGLPPPQLPEGFLGSPQSPQPVTTNYSFIQQGAGAVIAGHRDLLAFARALGRGKILSRQMRDAISRESVIANEPVRYGFGWLIRLVGNCVYWQHSGGNQGYVSDFAMSPDGSDVVVILSNLGFAEVSAYRKDAMQQLLTNKRCSSPAGGA